jgi:hypothetical protein
MRDPKPEAEAQDSAGGITLARIVALRGAILDYLNGQDPAACADRRARVSPFWSDIFGRRPNFPAPSECRDFLRSGHTYGVGGDRGDVLAEERYFRDKLAMVLQFVPADFLGSLAEPAFGNPPIFAHHGIVHSASFVINAGTLWRLRAVIGAHLSHLSGIDVLEIGAGYGAVSQLLQANVPSVRSYAICDLPENLFLSSLYLQANFPGKTAHFLRGGDKSGKVRSLAKDGLYFTLPHHLDALEARFHLVVNTFSMQEMDDVTVHAYMDWIRDHLHADGIFYSINSHAKAGIRKASEYGYGRFRILGLGVYRKSPSGYFNTIPYEAVLGLAQARATAQADRHLDALCEMMQLGLDGDLKGLCDDFAGGGLGPEDADFLNEIEAFFYADNATKKMSILDALDAKRGHPLIVSYLRGSLAFSVGDKGRARSEFEACLNGGLQDFARCRAAVNLLLMLDPHAGGGSDRAAALEREFVTASPNLESEIRASLSKRGSIAAHRSDLSRRLGLKAPDAMARRIADKVMQLIR